MSDTDIRLAAFDWLAEQVETHGDVLPWALLAWGFEHNGEQIRVVSQLGIFKPKVMELPLSIRTTFGGGPYDDSFSPDGLLRYRYRGDDPDLWDNRGLREAMRKGVPLVYFHAIAQGKYVAVWPVYIVGDQPDDLTFSVAVDDAELALSLMRQANSDEVAEYDTDSRRRYVTTLVRQRLRQRAFRERVLRAYREQCALCRLRHTELLDAAHIIPDPEDLGEPRVPNGLSLCKLHHAAFDSFFLTVRPDYRVVVRSEILEEEDGPMLFHGLQEIHHQQIVVPRNAQMRPDPTLLENRYERFQAAISS